MSSESQPKVVGIDVGGTKVAVAAVTGADARGMIERPTLLRNVEELLDGVEAAVGEVIELRGRPDAIGIGVPSQVDFASGRVVASVNIPLEGVSLSEELGRRFGVPVYVDNDANCAALAESYMVGPDPAHFLVMYTLGTGVGGGLVAGGEIYRGTTGLAPELGHVVVDPDGPACPGNCPNRGCLEALCSGTALRRDATELAQDRPKTPLGQIAKEKGAVRGQDVVRLARANDPDACELFERLGRWLGIGIADAANAFEPEHIVIGGGLSAAADLFLDTAKAEAASRALPALWENVEVAPARGGPAAGVVGAGLLAAHEQALRRDTAPLPQMREVR